MKQTIEVQDVEVKLDKNENKYLRIKTDKGWMSCFKSNCIDPIKNAKGQTISVETITAGKFTNVEKVYGEADPEEDTADIQIKKIPDKPSTDRVDRAKALEIAQGDIEKAEEYFNYITKGL